MIELRTLGSLDLTQDGQEVRAVLQQPKRLALLAYLAINTPRRFHRRDALLGMFWPELDQSHARAALRRAIYFLRQALGDDVIAGRGDEELAVREADFFSDVAGFEQAMAAGDFAAAVQLYRGDLLEGFYVSQAPEFERWLDLERVRLRDRAAGAVKALTEEAERKGDLTQASAWALRQVTLSPYDEVAFRKLVELLERTGDRAGALKAYDGFVHRLQAAYEIEPSPETRGLIGQIRRRQAKPPPEQPEPMVEATVADSAPRAIAILPFSVRGSAGLAYLGEGMMDLLSTKLEGAGDLRTIDPRALLTYLERKKISGGAPDTGRAVADRFGAGFYLLGSVVEAGGRLQITGSLYRRDGTPVASAETRGAAETEIFELVDDLARQLLADKHRLRGGRVTRLAALTTASLPALKAYLRGEHDFRQAKYFDAMDSFQQAVQLDSGFALAYYRLAAAQAASAMPELARESAAHAHEQRTRLASHDRLLLDAQRAWLAGSVAQAESLYQAIVANFPDDMEAWFLLGDLLFHSNPLRGRSVVEARQAFERALDLDPEHVTSLVHLVRIAAIEGRTEDRDRLIDRVIALSPDGDRALPMKALRAFARRQPDAIEQTMADLFRARTLTVGIAFSDIALYADNIEGAEQLVRGFLATGPNDDARALGHIGLAHLLVVQGRMDEARTELAHAQSLEPAWALEVRGLFAVLPFIEPDPVEIERVLNDLGNWNAADVRPSHNLPFAIHNDVHQQLRHYLIGLLSLRTGNLPGAERALAALEGLDAPASIASSAANLVTSLKAAIHWTNGDAAATLRTLDTMRAEVWFQLTVGSPFLSQALDRYTRGEALLALGRGTEAAGWLRSIAERSPIELIYRAPALRRLGG